MIPQTSSPNWSDMLALDISPSPALVVCSSVASQTSHEPVSDQPVVRGLQCSLQNMRCYPEPVQIPGFTSDRYGHRAYTSRKSGSLHADRKPFAVSSPAEG